MLVGGDTCPECTNLLGLVFPGALNPISAMIDTAPELRGEREMLSTRPRTTLISLVNVSLMCELSWITRLGHEVQ